MLTQANAAAPACPGDALDHQAQELLVTLEQLGHPGYSIQQRIPQDGRPTSYEVMQTGRHDKAWYTGQELIRMLQLEVSYMCESLLPSHAIAHDCSTGNMLICICSTNHHSMMHTVMTFCQVF